MKAQRTEIGSQKPEVKGRRLEVSSDLLAQIKEAYARGVVEHGDLGLALEDFAEKLSSILAKSPSSKNGANRTECDVHNTLNEIHTDDLYLTTACANGSEPAWERFASLHGNHIANVAHSLCPSHQQARELGAGMLGHLYLRDRSGQRRIGSYNGSGSLRSWLAMIIKYQSINQDQLKSKEAVPLDSLRNKPDPASTSVLEARLLESK